HAIAAENIRRYRGPRQRCFTIESGCGDACDFVFPRTPLVVYLFNPLSPHKLKTVIANLDGSVAECPREAYLLYHHAEHEHVLEEFPSLSKIGATHQYVIYTWRKLDDNPPDIIA